MKERMKCLFCTDCCVASCSGGAGGEGSWGRCNMINGPSRESFEVAVGEGML